MNRVYLLGFLAGIWFLAAAALLFRGNPTNASYFFIIGLVFSFATVKQYRRK